MRYRSIILVSIFTAVFIFGSVYQSKSQNTALEVLQKLSVNLDNYKTISYDYYRDINYFSENYHRETNGTSFIDFRNADKILGFKYQFENDQYKLIYNGAESFSINKKDSSIRVKYKPALSDLSSSSFLVNSVITLRNVLPVLIADRSINKTLTDTAMDNKTFHLVSFILHNKTIDGLGTFSPITLKRDFLYRLIIDKSTLLPLHIVQTNNAEPKDYMITSFSNIRSADLPEDSWYYSTYNKYYRSVSEKKLVLVKENTVAPDWTLSPFDNNESIALNSLKGKIVLLEFWIKNCGYCVTAVPKLNELAEKYRTAAFQVIGINAHDNKEDISNFYQRTKPNYKTVQDNMKVTNAYGVQAFPLVVLLDKKGIVLYSGDFDQERVDKLIKAALK